MFQKILSFITDTVYPFLKEIFQTFTFKDWLLLIMTVLTVVFFAKARQYETKNRELTNQYNIALTDYSNKIGQNYVRNQLQITEINRLKDENRSMYDEIKNLKDKPVIITKTETKFRVDTVVMESVKIVHEPGDSIYNLHWMHDEPGVYTVDGKTAVKEDFSDFETTIENLTVENELTLDVIDNGSNLEVIARSNNPYVTVTGMNNVFIDPRKSPTIKRYFKPKRWGLGIQAGYGIDKNLHGTWYIGVGASYNFIMF